MFIHVIFKEVVVVRNGGEEERPGVAFGWFCAVTGRIGRVIVSGVGKAKGEEGGADGQKQQNNPTLSSVLHLSKNALKAEVSEDRMRRRGRMIIFVTF